MRVGDERSRFISFILDLKVFIAVYLFVTFLTQKVFIYLSKVQACNRQPDKTRVSIGTRKAQDRKNKKSTQREDLCIIL